MADQPCLRFDVNAPDPYVGQLRLIDRPDDVVEVRWEFPPDRPITDSSTSVEVDGDAIGFRRLNAQDGGIYRAVLIDDQGEERTVDYRLEFRSEAVLVVHGIGEQPALNQAQTYTRALTRPWDRVDEDHFDVEGAEIRTRRFRINWRPAHVRPTDQGGALYYTDVYEHYWQPHVRDSKFQHFRRFLTTRLVGPQAVPARFHDLLVLLVVLLELMLVGLFLSGIDPMPRLLILAGYAVVIWVSTIVRARRHWLATALTATGGTAAGLLFAWATTRASTGILARPDLLTSGLIVASFLVIGLAITPIDGHPGGPRLRLWVDRPTSHFGRWAAWQLVTTTAVLIGANQLVGLGPRFEDYRPDAHVLDVVHLTWALPLLAAMVAGLLVAGLARPVAMRALVVLLGLSSFRVAAELVGGGADDTSSAWDNAIVQALLVAASGAALGWLVMHFGDVLRYLDGSPDNHRMRNQLADSGVDLLRRLHRDQVVEGEAAPDRIVVIAHSMGTQVAYDVLQRYWNEVSLHLPGAPADSPAEQARTQLKDDIHELYRAVIADPRRGEPLPVGEADRFEERVAFRATKDAVLASLNERAGAAPARGTGAAEPARWRVSDFVTLAAPLTHADYLYDDFATDLQARRFAADPPMFQPAEGWIRFGQARDDGESADVYHQAAPFAATRWTNLFYANDVIGGPVSGLFGPGIVDIEISDAAGLASVFPLNHSHYPSDERVREALRGILHPSLVPTVRPSEHLVAQAHHRARVRLERFLPAGDDWSWYTAERLERAGRTDDFLAGYRIEDRHALFDGEPVDEDLLTRTRLIPEPMADLTDEPD